jgi:tryptophanyl-tRNA synthetase
MDLQDPTSKMSKSADSPQGTLSLLDEPDALAKRIRSAVTDSDGEVRFDPATKPGVSNLLQILAATTNREIPAVEAEFAGGGYGALKAAVAEAVVEFVRPLQARYAELERDPGEVDRIVAAGAARAEEIAAPVIARVRDAAGLMPRA